MSLAEVGAVIPVDKPVGPTSHDVVAFARRALGVRRVGHTGTLDPFASGLLLLCVGPATRLSEYLTGLDKEYVATARLGETTDTDDRDGAVVEVRGGWERMTAAEIGKALGRFVGPIDQVPPQYSAKKVAGESMHRRARRGEHVALEPTRVHVYEVELDALDLPRVSFRVRCSSGTYVRALARDLGAALGVGAHLTELRRTSVGRFRVEDALPMEALTDPDAIARVALSPLDALAHLPRMEVDPETAARLAHGQRVSVGEWSGLKGPAPGADPALPVAVTSRGGLLAIGRIVDGVLAPAKVFA